MAQTEINRALLKTLRPEMEKALAEVAAKHGITIEVANGKYAGETGTFKIELSTLSDDGRPITQDMVNLKQRLAEGEWTGFRPSDIDEEFEYAGATMRLVGYNPRAKKWPFNVEVVKDATVKRGRKMETYKAGSILRIPEKNAKEKLEEVRGPLPERTLTKHDHSRIDLDGMLRLIESDLEDLT